MSVSSVSRSGLYLWALVFCPAIGWWFGVYATRDEADTVNALLFFVGLPGLLAFVGAFLFGGGLGHAVVGSVLAATLGGTVLYLTILAVLS
jgi:hypothetical protein